MKAVEPEIMMKAPPSLQKILVAVDLSDHSIATVRYAAEIARYFDASLTISHVYSPQPMDEFASGKSYGALLERQQNDALTRLDELTYQVRAFLPACKPVLLVGDPAEQISTFARNSDTDLIVTASHHPSFLGRLFGLDQAPKIMHRAPCSVLVYQEKNWLVLPR